MASNSNMGCKSLPEKDKLGLDQVPFPGDSECLVKGKAPA